jgi:hypothetical protein
MRYLMGSRYFFGMYEDFISHDTDYVELTDNDSVKCLVNIKGRGVDTFIFRRKPKEQMIEDALSSKLPMAIGKFLIPEFCKELSFTIYSEATKEEFEAYQKAQEEKEKKLTALH